MNTARAMMLAVALLAAQQLPVVAHETGTAESERLPVGDGRVTDHPAVGNVYSCQSAFRVGGALHVGEWFHGDTWNPAEKPRVRGSVMWPQAAFELTERGAVLDVNSNAFPVGQPTGEFPIAPGDPVYRYDRNPNEIREADLNFEIPASPARFRSFVPTHGNDWLRHYRGSNLQCSR